MGAPTGGKGQQPPNMQGMAPPYAPQGGQQAQPRGGQYPQAMNMAQGWGGGWSQQPPQGGYQGGSPMQFGGGWWGPQQNVPQMQPWGAQAGGNMAPAQGPQPWGAQAGGNMAPAQGPQPWSLDAYNSIDHVGNFEKLWNQDKELANRYLMRSELYGPSQWKAQKERIFNEKFGGNLVDYNRWINDSSYNTGGSRDAELDAIFGKSLQPLKVPWEWVARGQYNPDGTLRAQGGQAGSPGAGSPGAGSPGAGSPGAGSPGAGNNVMQTFDQLYKEDPRLAYHFMQRGGPQNWNANKEAIQQQYFGGDLQRYNQFVNDSDYGNLSDQERWRLNDLAGLPSPDRPGGVAPAAPGAVNNAPVGGVSLQTPASASPQPMLQGPLPWQKASQPPPPRMKDARWRGLMPGGSPAWRDMAINN